MSNELSGMKYATLVSLQHWEQCGSSISILEITLETGEMG